MKELLCASLDEDGVLSCHFRHKWPTESLDLNPCHYCYLKSQDYRDRPNSLGMLIENIRMQYLTILTDMLHSFVLNDYRVLPNSTYKFKRVITGSRRTTIHQRTWCRKPRLVDENRNNNSRQEEDELDERSGQTKMGICSTVVGLKKPVHI
ncbi:hypothetical protein TNCV_342491 [Trichonephila clavipes]|nr:hypothetical protein TNCV_342491 [Trichonephila clavipes]